RGDHGQIPRVLTEGTHRRSEQRGEEVPRAARFRLRRLSTTKIARVHTGPDPIDNHTWLHRGPHVPSSAREHCLRAVTLPWGGPDIAVRYRADRQVGARSNPKRECRL